MNKETIEKAANEKYADNTFAYKGFIEGAQWRINSVWHSTNELPKYSGFLAASMNNGLMETMFYSVGIGFHEKHLRGYALWAYIEDLLPDRKEDE